MNKRKYLDTELVERVLKGLQRRGLVTVDETGKWSLTEKGIQEAEAIRWRQRCGLIPSARPSKY